MLIQKNTKIQRRGSIAVESAILLPLFIIGILTIGYLLKFCMISEGVHHALSDEAHKIMAEAPLLPYPIFGEQDIVKRINDESRGEAQNVRVGRFLYRMPGISKSGQIYTDLIAASVSFETPLKLPRLFISELEGERTILCRAFVGMEQQGSPKPFSEMEEDDSGGTVWIFPRAGERYHDEHCAYIENNPREVLLDKNVRSRYTPCKLCKPDARRDGTLVYCFFTSGKAYHSGECTIVERYVIEIGKEEAESQGYTACSKCGGG
jgi:hypothetical protein